MCKIRLMILTVHEKKKTQSQVVKKIPTVHEGKKNFANVNIATVFSSKNLIYSN